MGFFFFYKIISRIILKEYKCSVLDRELDKGHRCRFDNFAIYKRTSFTTERRYYACTNQNLSFYNHLHQVYFLFKSTTSRLLVIFIYFCTTLLYEVHVIV